jgi:hypothetical protein
MPAGVQPCPWLRSLLTPPSDLLQLFFGQMFETNEGVLRFTYANQFVELDLDGCSVAILGILNEEHHEKRYNGGARVDHELPSIREIKEWARYRPHHDDRKGESKHPGPSRFAGSHRCKLRKHSGRWVLAIIGRLSHTPSCGVLLSSNLSHPPSRNSRVALHQANAFACVRVPGPTAQAPQGLERASGRSVAKITVL